MVGRSGFRTPGSGSRGFLTTESRAISYIVAWFGTCWAAQCLGFAFHHLFVTVSLLGLAAPRVPSPRTPQRGDFASVACCRRRAPEGANRRSRQDVLRAFVRERRPCAGEPRLRGSRSRTVRNCGRRRQEARAGRRASVVSGGAHRVDGRARPPGGARRSRRGAAFRSSAERRLVGDDEADLTDVHP